MKKYTKLNSLTGSDEELKRMLAEFKEKLEEREGKLEEVCCIKILRFRALDKKEYLMIHWNLHERSPLNNSHLPITASF